MNSKGIDNVNHSDEADEGPHKHEWRGWNKPGLKSLVGAFLDPNHYGDQRHSKGQTAVGERHFKDILVHNQGFGV
jgi:hypothetical protein